LYTARPLHMAKSVTDVTAVLWYWRGDNGWIKYDDASALKLEVNFSAGKEKIPVDNERFIDCSLGLAEIKKNFHNVDAPDKELVGVQRRYDDEMKRRAVRREIPNSFLKGTAIYIALDDDDKKDDIARTPNIRRCCA